MAYSRSEVVLSTDPARLARSPEDHFLGDIPWMPPTEEVIRLSPPPRIPPHPQREWQHQSGADA